MLTNLTLTHNILNDNWYIRSPSDRQIFEFNFHTVADIIIFCIGEKGWSPMERIQVVVRYSNGRIIKGHTIDFFPNKDRFHVNLIDKPSDSPIEVMVNQLKAVFVVRDLKGNPQYTERKSYIEGETPYGTPLELTFEDGEVMVGSTIGFDLRRQGFFITPADPNSNNLRVFVVCSALKRIRQLLLKAGESIEVSIPGKKR